MYNAPRHIQVDVPLKPRLYRHPHGICAVDAEYLYPGHAAAHIIEDGGRAAFVDVGTNASVPYLLAGLVELGIAPEAVEYVLLTVNGQSLLKMLYASKSTRTPIELNLTRFEKRMSS